MHIQYDRPYTHRSYCYWHKKKNKKKKKKLYLTPNVGYITYQIQN